MHDLLGKWLTEDELVKAIEQHRLYREGSGVWARPAAAAAASRSSACPCETNWSTYQFIHSPERNRLDPVRAESLVFVHSNVRLLRKLEAVDYHEKFPAYPSESDEDSDAEAESNEGWASEESDEGDLGSGENSGEDEDEEDGDEDD